MSDSIRKSIRRIIREMASGWWTEPEIDISEVASILLVTDRVDSTDCLDFGAKISVHRTDFTVIDHLASDVMKSTTGLGHLPDWTDVSLHDMLRSLESLGMPHEVSLGVYDRATVEAAKIINRQHSIWSQILIIEVFPPSGPIGSWTSEVHTEEV